MPRRDGTGPMCAGPMSGKGLGLCVRENIIKYGSGFGKGFGFGLACRHGFGCGFRRGFAVNQPTAKTQKELLQEQKEALQNRMEAIDKQLESL